MESLYIGLGMSPGAKGEGEKRYAAVAIQLAKALVFNDYHHKYGGIAIALAGAIVPGRGLFGQASTPQRRVCLPWGPKGLSGGLWELADDFLKIPRGYCTIEEMPELVRLDSDGCPRRPISFLALEDHRHSVEEFIQLAEREGVIHPDLDSLIVDDRGFGAIKGVQSDRSPSSGRCPASIR